MGNIPEGFVFSQSSLQAYVDCPRRFDLRYLRQQRYPAQEVDDMLEFEVRMQRGQRFHQLVHQHLMGIPQALLIPRIKDDIIRQWFDHYLQSGLTAVPEKRYPEQVVTVPIGDTYLLAKFDLVAVGDSAIIIDWKTSQYIPKRVALADKLQTIVYRYVLARASDRFNEGQSIAPENITMRYWFAAHDGETIDFTYDQAQYEADEGHLLALIQEIDSRDDFPLTLDTNKCRFCTYRSLCERGVEAGHLSEYDLLDYELDDISFEIDIDQIAEIEF